MCSFTVAVTAVVARIYWALFVFLFFIFVVDATANFTAGGGVPVVAYFLCVFIAGGRNCYFDQGGLGLLLLLVAAVKRFGEEYVSAGIGGWAREGVRGWQDSTRTPPARGGVAARWSIAYHNRARDQGSRTR